ncbi:alpha-(1,3)-fucosyltransferase C-like isoform X2 [Panulirus ornatus]|uniref:alpha-(1,3)-fucosyltransferase C-like isoform X2 n=1 Tax=Panulirus ornatus TaxID=150431 RepID=UPI003A8516B1
MDQTNKLEQENILKEKLEQENILMEKLEQENILKEKLEQENILMEKLEQENILREKLEQENILMEKLEQENILKEKLEQENILMEKLEQENILKEKLEQENSQRATEDANAPQENQDAEELSQRSASPGESQAGGGGTESVLLPGDTHFPYEEPNYEKITQHPPQEMFKEKPGSGVLDPNNPPLKKILYWNDNYGNKHFGFGFGREPFLRAGCRVNTCMTTGSRTRFPAEEIDAIIWHFRSKDKSLPDKRSPHTRYVFWMMESASHLFGNLQPYNYVFNWTFTYRLDSDFPNPYGRVYRRRHPLPAEDRNYAAGKTKLAAWFVSNCHTIGGREKLVQTLRNFIQIDQYGHCGNLRCERKDQTKCHAMLSSDYKFYFSFENSLCLDYATEKFFNMLRLDVVPVVYGLGSYTKQAPPHSYIDSMNFPTAKSLAEYLLYLDRNDTAYNEYYRWKRFHQLPHEWARVAKTYCDMCERLHLDNTTKVYNLKKWFEKDSHCKTGKDMSALINPTP